MDHPRPWLRYVDADDLDDDTTHFDGVPVESSSGDKLGKIKGFVVDANTGRPYYLVVDAGGWFKSKLFLLPVGHARLDAARNAMVSDLTKDHVDKFPGFDLDNFDKLSDEDPRRIDTETLAACCPGEKINLANGPGRYDEWAHYRRPEWWKSDYPTSSRATSSTPSSDDDADDYVVVEEVVEIRALDPDESPSSASPGSSSSAPREQVSGRADDDRSKQGRE